MERRYPNGPKFNLAMVAIAQMFPKRLPFDALAFALDLARQYGDIAYYSFGPLQTYYLNHPDLVRQVAVEQADKFYKPRLIKYAFRPFAGQGLLTNDGDSGQSSSAFHARSRNPAMLLVVTGRGQRGTIERLWHPYLVESLPRYRPNALGLLVSALQFRSVPGRPEDSL